jgi:hypothetical protein
MKLFVTFMIALLVMVGGYFTTAWLDGLMGVTFAGIHPVWVYTHKLAYAFFGALLVLGAGWSLK